MFNLIVKDP